VPEEFKEYYFIPASDVKLFDSRKAIKPGHTFTAGYEEDQAVDICGREDLYTFIPTQW
jgi:hypothetical protein